MQGSRYNTNSIRGYKDETEKSVGEFGKMLLASCSGQWIPRSHPALVMLRAMVHSPECLKIDSPPCGEAESKETRCGHMGPLIGPIMLKGQARIQMAEAKGTT